MYNKINYLCGLKCVSPYILCILLYPIINYIEHKQVPTKLYNIKTFHYL